MKIKYFFQGFKEGQKLFGEAVFGIFNFLMLTLVYFFGVGLTSIMAKLSKKKFLEENITPQNQTYWEDLNLNKHPLQEYYRQF